jgi:biotin carboxylase
VENDVSARISYINGAHPNLIREQIRLALGEPMGYAQEDIEFRGASIELRIVAENPARDFTPWIGTITRFDLPRYEWSALYSHVPSDRPYPIPSEYDPNLALALVWGDSMEEAKKRAREFIDHARIEGENSSGEPILTNLDYLRENLDRLLTF